LLSCLICALAGPGNSEMGNGRPRKPRNRRLFLTSRNRSREHSNRAEFHGRAPEQGLKGLTLDAPERQPKGGPLSPFEGRGSPESKVPLVPLVSLVPFLPSLAIGYSLRGRNDQSPILNAHFSKNL